jgi:hypothetical protein
VPKDGMGHGAWGVEFMSHSFSDFDYFLHAPRSLLHAFDIRQKITNNQQTY